MGALRAEIPFTNLYTQAMSLTVDEALLTLRPRGAGANSGAAAPGRQGSVAAAPTEDVPGSCPAGAAFCHTTPAPPWASVFVAFAAAPEAHSSLGCAKK